MITNIRYTVKGILKVYCDHPKFLILSVILCVDYKKKEGLTMATIDDLTPEQYEMYGEALDVVEEAKKDVQSYVDDILSKADVEIKGSAFDKLVEDCKEDDRFQEEIKEKNLEHGANLEEYIYDKIDENIFDILYDLGYPDVFIEYHDMYHYYIHIGKGVDNTPLLENGDISDAFRVFGVDDNQIASLDNLEKTYIQFHEEQAHDTTMAGFFEQWHGSELDSIEATTYQAVSNARDAVRNVEDARESLVNILENEISVQDILDYM